MRIHAIIIHSTTDSELEPDVVVGLTKAEAIRAAREWFGTNYLIQDADEDQDAIASLPKARTIEALKRWADEETGVWTITYSNHPTLPL